jgi:hypothetical protein
MKSPSRPRYFCVALCCMAGTLVGCEEPLEFGHVTGKVSQNGKPLDEVLVLFLPDTMAGNLGAHSECISDADGNYELIYSQDPDTKGALVGFHRVIVEDIAAENAREKRRPIRISAKYSSSAQTPLSVEVAPGEQTVDLELDRKR